MRLSDLPYVYEVRDDYQEQRREGILPEEVLEDLLQQNRSEVNDPDDAPQFWVGIALAQTQWKEVLEAHRETMISALEQLRDGMWELSDGWAEKLIGKLRDPDYAQPPRVHRKIKDRVFLDLHIGDTYIKSLDPELARQYHLEGASLLFRVADLNAPIDHLAYPIIYIMVWTVSKPPESMEQLDKAGFVRSFTPRHLDKFPGFQKRNHQTLEYRWLLAKDQHKIKETKERLQGFRYVGCFPEARNPSDGFEKKSDLWLSATDLFGIEREVCWKYEKHGLLFLEATEYKENLQ